MHLVLNLIQRHSREEHHRKSRPMFLQIGEDAKAVQLRQIEVQEQQIDLAMLEMMQSRLAVTGFIDLISCTAKQMRQGHSFHGRIIAHQ